MYFNFGHGMGGFGMMGGMVSLMFFVVFIGVVIIIGMVVVKMLRESGRNHMAPILSVQATVIGKRAEMRNNYTWYYVTFQVESGDRLEYNVMNTEFGMLAEGDSGKLTFQGGRYMGFERYAQGQNRPQ